MKPLLAALAIAVGGLAALPASAAPDPALVAAGKKHYDYWCATCHAAGGFEGGRSLPGTASLEVKYKGSKPSALEARDDLVDVFVKQVIRKGSEGMPFFRKTEISDREADEIAAYLGRNLK